MGDRSLGDWLVIAFLVALGATFVALLVALVVGVWRVVLA